MNKKILLPVITCIVCVSLAVLVSLILKFEHSGELQHKSENTTESSAVSSLETASQAAAESAAPSTSLQTTEIKTTVKNADNKKHPVVRINASQHFNCITTARVFNNELQAYISSQVKFSGNKVILTAEKLPQKYVSGKVESKQAFRYGEFHFKVNSLSGKGLFPAIWLMPASGELLPEIDIFELLGNSPYRVSGVMHYMNNGIQDKYFFKHDFSKTNVPQTYDVKFKWTKDFMVWSVNGQELLRVTEDVPDIPMYLIFNLAIGGNWPGDPDENTPFPSSFNVEILEIKPTETFAR